MGKKYIIEIPDDKIGDFVGSTHFLMPYMMAGHIGHHDTGLPIEPYTEPDMEQVRKEAYDKGYDDATAEISSDEQAIAEKAYQKGLSDAWTAARKIGGMDSSEQIRLFTCSGIYFIAHEYSASECIEKIRQYEQEKEEQITKGDIVLIKSTPEVEILVTFADEEYVSGIALTEVDGNCEIGDQYTNIRISNVENTGKHYDIVSVLQKMKES